MDVRIAIETTFDNGEKRTHQLDSISRPYRVTCPDGIGLRLEDGKKIAEQFQRVILYDQVEEITRESRVCPDCASVRAIHDYRTRVLDTTFGRVRVEAARLRRCSCDVKSAAMPGGPISPLAYFFPDRATPELQRFHAELGSRHSFREAARLMKSFLPCHPPHHATVRARLGRIAERLECSRRASSSPAEVTPKGGLTVFLDGAHIRCRPEYQQRHLDLVVGKIESRNICRRFGMVVNATASPRRRMREELSAFEWKPGRLLTVISDGEAALPNLIRNATNGDGPVKHILDWWHFSMRVQHVEAAVQGLVQTQRFAGNPVLFQRPAKSLRWWLWHGRARVAETYLKGLMHDCASFAEEPQAVRAAAARVQARCETLYTYLANNMESLVDYGRRYRSGLPISSSRAESSVDDIANARMGKRRRMRWSLKGAHRVAVTRAAVLDGRLTVTNSKRAA
ncbi:ISKra4 family transposase [Cypionkella psychrotolerans]|uniref:ISKra4 family transposase n=1 Tax=Cypionkella psychrotolerans TaxID=1678131 RepID=UPI0006B559A9|nr:ISKra4 family transposase [Cypionkella psychrotolerans]